MIDFKVTSVVATLLMLAAQQLIALPQHDADKHLGVASCASSVCHGKSKAVDAKNVMLNEYRTWSTKDRHARAYKTLLSKESKRIASNLGLSSAHTAKICLDCHADNVAKDMRGPKFQINDGVGCEACHGGAEQWIKSHTEMGVTHQQNLDKNMYPTESGVERARLCLSCHYGTKDKLATHKIMGAGHPRLSFELETFTSNQPMHYKVDADYKERKGEFGGFTMWVTGQLEAAKISLELMQSYLISDDQLLPELYFYDCHACHHPMSDKRWQPTAARSGVPPGAVRLNDVSFLMLQQLIQTVLPESYSELTNAVINLHKSSMRNRTDLKKSLVEMTAIIATLDKQLTAQSYSAAQAKAVRAGLLKQAAAGQYRDFVVAEQAFLAIESITIGLKQDHSLENQLNSLYDTLDDEDDFNPQKFRTVANTISGAFN